MSAVLVAAAGPSPLWYLTRGTGLVSLLLLSTSVCLGIVTSGRWSTTSWPRFVNAELHRWVSLLVLATLAVHIVTAELDTFAPVGWLAVVVPFASPYRAVWLGLGTLAFDLLLALVVTSLLRARIGHRTWRAVHWAAYACWPVAVVHGLGTGTDARTGWVQLLTVVCVLAVVGAVGVRLSNGFRTDPARRLVLGLAVVVAVAAVGSWAAAGPLKPGWSKRAGTPAALLASSSGAATAPAASGQTGTAAGPTTTPSAGTATAPSLPFSASLDGTLRQEPSGGNVTVTIRTRVSGSVGGTLSVVLGGRASGGGVSLSSSAVTLTLSHPSVTYRGTVTALSGDQMAALVTAPGGAGLQLGVNLRIAPSTGQVAGTLSAAAAGQGGDGGGGGDSGGGDGR